MATKQTNTGRDDDLDTSEGLSEADDGLCELGGYFEALIARAAEVNLHG